MSVIAPLFTIFWILTIIFTIVLAIKKGYSGILAFLLGLFIPLLGSLIVIALLPNKNESFSSYKETPTQKPSSTVNSPLDLSKISSISSTNTGDTWVCKKCNERNPLTAASCKSCGEYK
jgi:ribosomal protein L40E